MSAARTEGVARLGKRTKDLTKRLRPGEIAIIDHEDIDRVAAEALVEREPAAVLNVAASTSGRYPNAGPRILVDAGIVLVDSLGDEVFEGIRDGEQITVEDGRVLLEGEPIAEGARQDDASVTASQEASREGLSEQLELFAENTMEYMLRERDLLLDGIGAPEVATRMDGRPVLIVVRGYHYKEDLATLKPFLRENRPVIIGVDGGADAVLEAGFRPDMIIGDMDSVSDAALTSGAEIVVHAYKDGRAPGVERVSDLGVECVTFPASGTSEDIAMLLADDKGAQLIVAVGTHDTLIEFLDKGRKGMASTFITRLRVGSKLLDAKGVSLLYRQRIGTMQLMLLALAGLVALGAAVSATAAGQTAFGLLAAQFDGFFQWLGDLFGGSSAEALPAAPWPTTPTN